MALLGKPPPRPRWSGPGLGKAMVARQPREDMKDIRGRQDCASSQAVQKNNGLTAMGPRLGGRQLLWHFLQLA
jgi:hypothetical protein